MDIQTVKTSCINRDGLNPIVPLPHVKKKEKKKKEKEWWQKMKEINSLQSKISLPYLNQKKRQFMLLLFLIDG